MPDSLRDLLHRRAAEGIADADLTAGALQRARAIGHRRTAAVAVGAVVGIAAASVAAASLIQPNPHEPSFPATSSTTPVEEPTEDTEPDDIDTDDHSGSEPDGGVCGLPDLPEWTGWGDSEASTTLEQLPETLYFRDNWDDRVFVAVTESGAEVVLEDGSGKYVLAPDGFRYVRAAMCTSEILTVGHLGDGVGPIDLGGHFCMPSWSPDSNRLIAWSEDPEGFTGFVIDVASGAVTEISGEVSCDAMWTGDGEHLVWIGGDSLIEYADRDGSTRSTGASLSEWFTGGQGILGLSGVSAGMTHACMEQGDPEYGSSGHWTPVYCDRYIDLATQEERELPVSGERNQVVFLPDGSMLIAASEGQALTVYLVGPAGDVVDQREIRSEVNTDARLVAWFTDRRR